MHARCKPSIVSRGNPVCAKSLCMFEEGAKLDASIAFQVRVGGKTPAILGHKVGEHLSPVLVHKVNFIQWDAQMVADTFGVLLVFFN